MPAPAVIPAPIVYFKVVAVKTLVVYLRVMDKYSSKSYKVFLSSIRIGNFIILSKDIKVLISVLSLLIPLLRS